MIQFLVFTGMMVIIQIEAVIVQAVSLVTRIVQIGVLPRFEIRMTLVNPAPNVEVISTSLWGLVC